MWHLTNHTLVLSTINCAKKTAVKLQKMVEGQLQTIRFVFNNRLKAVAEVK